MTKRSEVLIVPADILTEATAACNPDIMAFKTGEYRRLRSHGDPTETLIQETFGRMCERHGDVAAYQYMAGSLVVTRSVYISAEQQGVIVEPPRVELFRSQLQQIVERLRPSVPLDISDIDQQFPLQPDLCRTIQDFQFSASKVGALTVAGLYVHHLIEPGRTAVISMSNQSLAFSAPSSV